MSQNEHNRDQAANDGTDAPRPENAHGLAGQQQGSANLNPGKSADTSGWHGGNHGNDGGQRTRDAKGSSHRGDEPNAESNNTGGGSDNDWKNQTKNTTADRSDYGTGNAAPSAANDGGTINDPNNQ